MNFEPFPMQYIVIFMVLGLFLAFVRPFWAFMLITFVASAFNYKIMNVTKLPGLSAMNSLDLCLVIGTVAMFVYKLSKGETPRVPRVVKFIIPLLIIGFFESVYVYGFAYNIIRSLRWALDFPIYFTIAYNMVDDRDKVRSFMVTLFMGAVGSAVNHINYVTSMKAAQELFGGNPMSYRTIAYRGAGYLLLVAGLIWLPAEWARRKVVLGLGACLFIVSQILNQTRSIWLGMFLSYLVGFFVFKHEKTRQNAIRSVVYLSLAVLVVGVFMTSFIDFADPSKILKDRLEKMDSENQRGRLLALQMESEAWLSSNLLFGRGLNYFLDIEESRIYYNVAFNHLGYLTTLAQLGLVGFFIYFVYMPYDLMSKFRYAWYNSEGHLKFAALYFGICLLYFQITFLASDSYLTISPLKGLMLGAGYSVYFIAKRSAPAAASQAKAREAGTLEEAQLKPASG